MRTEILLVGPQNLRGIPDSMVGRQGRGRLSAGQGVDVGEDAAEAVARDFEVVASLQVHPEALRGSDVAGQPERGVGATISMCSALAGVQRKQIRRGWFTRMLCCPARSPPCFSSRLPGGIRASSSVRRRRGSAVFAAPNVEWSGRADVSARGARPGRCPYRRTNATRATG